MRICGIDPGPEESALVLWDTEYPITSIGAVRLGLGTEGKILEKMIVPTTMVCGHILHFRYDVLAIEDIKNYGMKVGQSVFKTLKWIGEMRYAANSIHKKTYFINRSEVVVNLCHTTAAKKGNVNLVLRDRFGGKGTKKDPGYMYGLDKGGTGHMFDAFAVAVTCWDMFYKEG